MLYNKENPQWQFNEEQYLSRDEYYRIVGEFDELCKKMFSVDVRDFNSQFYGIKETGTLEEQEAKRKKGIIGIICGMLVFAALVLSLVLKQLVIFGYTGCAVFLFVGISMVISGRGEAVESTSKAIINRVIGAGISLASVALILLIIFRNRFAGAEFFLLIFAVVFGISGLVLLVVAILRVLSGKIVYTEEIYATCAGYVRRVDRESGNNGIRHTFILTSPLFKYSYGGVQYEAIWDEFVAKEDLDIAMGESVKIRIDPKHPENIKSPASTHPGVIIFMTFMAVVCIAAGIGMGIYISGGAAKGMTVETEWNPVINQINGETTRTKITDDMIKSHYQDKYNITDEWYYEIGTVATKTYTAEGQRITFTDEAFAPCLYAEGGAPEPGTELMFFYTVDETYLSSGANYKRIFTTGDPDEFEYAGSHGAYVPG